MAWIDTKLLPGIIGLGVISVTDRDEYIIIIYSEYIFGLILEADTQFGICSDLHHALQLFGKPRGSCVRTGCPINRLVHCPRTVFLLLPESYFVLLSFSRPEFILDKLLVVPPAGSQYRANRDRMWADVKLRELDSILLYRFQKAGAEERLTDNPRRRRQ